jgi:hypothetical protein
MKIMREKKSLIVKKKHSLKPPRYWFSKKKSTLFGKTTRTIKKRLIKSLFYIGNSRYCHIADMNHYYFKGNFSDKADSWTSP